MNDTLTLLKDLRALKNSGTLDDPENLADRPNLWRNKLDYNALVDCVKHHSEEIRLIALTLVIESKKSTQCFTKMDLDVIEIFLKYNLGERMEYVPLIKKALKRMKESLAVQRRHIAKDEKLAQCECALGLSETERHQYEGLRNEASRLAGEAVVLIRLYARFFESLRQICIDGLRPGSTNARKRSSLLILQLSQEFLDNEFADSSPWKIDQADKLFECLSLDTYEANKETIYRIATKLDPRLLRLHDPVRVREILDVALDLANCIRPIDSITASYMLKISLLSPVIDQVLENYHNRNEIPSDTLDQAKLRLIAIVLERLKGPLKLAEENIVAAAGKHSLYGYLFCIRNLLGVCDLGRVIKHHHEAWTRTIADTITTSLRLNKAVSQIVNNSSPEGHLPMDMDSSNLQPIVSESHTIATVTPQMVLICSWRTVKEVSLLFGYLSSKSPIISEHGPDGLLKADQLVAIGEHLVTLLFETKHRGAFEQAHVGFGQLCNRLWRSDQESLQKLPRLWLHHLMLAISGLSPGNAKLCATRRSAGVPFMVQALVSSDPNVQSNPSSAVFHSVMKILLGFTDLDDGGTAKSLMYEGTIFADFQDSDNTRTDEDTTRLSQEAMTERKTHSLNILRALFKHAQLGDLSKNYAAEGLAAAIRSYDGKTWAERNAATLLFSSLIIRIFGVQRTKDHVNLTLHNKMTGRIFFERYPSLLPFVLNELQAFVDSSDTVIKPSVQSILLLLSRLYPSFNSDETDSKWKIDEFVKLVSACAKSRVYNTRELSARALVPLLTDRTVRSCILDLFEKISSVVGQRGASFNARHGYALQVLEITRSPRFSIAELPLDRLEDYVFDTRWIIEDLERTNDRSACFPLAAVHVTTLRELSDRGINEGMKKLFPRLMEHLNDPRILKRLPGRDIYELAAAEFFVRNSEKFPSFLKTWNSILNHENTQVRISAWTGVINDIEKSKNQDLVGLTISRGLEAIGKTIVDPDLQDAIYRCLYEILGNLDDLDKFLDEKYSLLDVCYFALEILVRRDHFRESPNFLRFIGKAYGKLRRSCEGKNLRAKYERTVYKTFLGNSWMGSADTACRIAVSSVLDDLFVENNADDCLDYCSLLDWWTSLLNLLVDDNSEVRKNASEIVHKMESSKATDLECISSTMEKFFDIFFIRTMTVPSVTFAALFAWSTSLTGDTDYEMDESDVFNKCYNYEIFEPLQISERCDEKLSKLVEHSPEVELPLEIREWLAERLGNSTESTSFTSARDLIHEYGKSVPTFEGVLRDVIDPTHNDKLLRSMAYENFVLWAR